MSTDTDTGTVAVLDDPRAEPVIHWTSAALKELTVVAVVAGGTGSYTLHWGDGTSADVPAGSAPLAHTYPGPRTYAASLRQGTVEAASTQIWVRPDTSPQFSLAAPAGEHNIVELTIEADPQDMVGRYAIDWQDGGPVETLLAAKGTVVRHGYPAGEHTVAVTDLLTNRSGTKVVTVTDPAYDPDFVLRQGTDANTAELELTVLGTAKPVLVDWGDGKQQTIDAPAVGTKVSHSYTEPAVYLVQGVYADGTGSGAVKAVTIPFPGKDEH